MAPGISFSRRRPFPIPLLFLEKELPLLQSHSGSDFSFLGFLPFSSATQSSDCQTGLRTDVKRRPHCDGWEGWDCCWKCDPKARHESCTKSSTRT